jgi:hypothetical protein
MRRAPLPLGASPGAARTLVEPASPGRYRVRIVAPGARTLELSGDPTAWKPVTLERDATGEWSVILALAPGTYHVVMRVDGGAWKAPPGLPTVPDEFRGASGLIVIPG